MIKKLFSGGQPGADRAGLMAARKMGIQTGGWVSARDFETDPWLWYHFGKFGMKVADPRGVARHIQDPNFMPKNPIRDSLHIHL